MNPTDRNRTSNDTGTGPERREPTRHPDPTHQHPPADNQRETGVESGQTRESSQNDDQQDKVRRSNLAGDEDVSGEPVS